MARFEIKSITIGFGGLYANLHFTDGSKKEVKADWYNQNFPIAGDFVDIEDGSDVKLIRPWMLGHEGSQE
jgi:hypothetical protein